MGGPLTDAGRHWDPEQVILIFPTQAGVQEDLGSLGKPPRYPIGGCLLYLRAYDPSRSVLQVPPNSAPSHCNFSSDQAPASELAAPNTSFNCKTERDPDTTPPLLLHNSKHSKAQIQSAAQRAQHHASRVSLATEFLRGMDGRPELQEHFTAFLMPDANPQGLSFRR